MQIFSTAPFIYLLSFFSSFMLLNVHRRYRGGGWGGVEYLCPLLVTVKNFTTACRSLLFYVPCQCQELHDYMQITIYPVSFASQCQELHDCMQIAIILCPLPMSRTSRLHTDHYLSCVDCQSMSRTLFSVLGVPFYPCGN